jgi:hypothetical protein
MIAQLFIFGIAVAGTSTASTATVEISSTDVSASNGTGSKTASESKHAPRLRSKMDSVWSIFPSDGAPTTPPELKSNPFWSRWATGTSAVSRVGTDDDPKVASVWSTWLRPKADGIWAALASDGAEQTTPPELKGNPFWSRWATGTSAESRAGTDDDPKVASVWSTWLRPKVRGAQGSTRTFTLTDRHTNNALLQTGCLTSAALKSPYLTFKFKDGSDSYTSNLNAHQAFFRLV